VLLTNDNWAYVFQIHAQSTDNSAGCIFFFISWIIIGQKIFMNLFLAILLESWDTDTNSKELIKSIETKKKKELMNSSSEKLDEEETLMEKLKKKVMSCKKKTNKMDLIKDKLS
jgi:hypothetical protein